MRIGARTRMGARTRGTCRMPTMIVDGDLTVLGNLDATGGAVMFASLGVTDLVVETITAPGDQVTVNSDVDLDGNLEMQAARRILLDTATSITLTPLGFRGDDGEGIAYVGAGSWRSVAGGANMQTYSLGLYSQNGTAAISTLSLTGSHSYTGAISPAALTGDVTDWAPASLGVASRIRIDPGAAGRTINSLGTAAAADGRRIRLLNISTTQTVTLNHDDGTGTAACRFLCPDNVDYVIPILGFVDVEYDLTTGRWRVS